MNLNELAVAVSQREGKKQQVNIAQIKEILKITFEIIFQESIFRMAEDHTRNVITAKASTKVRAKKKAGVKKKPLGE